MTERVENCTLNRNWIWNGKEYIDIISWNAAIEAAVQLLEEEHKIYPQHIPARITTAMNNMRKLKK